MATQVQAQQTRTESRFPPSTPSFETISPPQSQTSSFNESLASQPVETLDKTIISQQSSLLRTASPATSVSNRSSQESALSPPPKVGRDRGTHDPTSGGTGARLSSQPSTARDRPTSAPKRMLNGEIKSGGSSLLTSPVDSRQLSRRTSRESQAAELKDRLAFAKYKLDHGYTDLKFSDVEAITSQQGSPVSAASELRHTSPRKSASLQRPPNPTAHNSRPSGHSPQHSQSNQSQSIAGSARTPQLPSSYDDFWNSQLQSRPPILAPPPDLRPAGHSQYQSNQSTRASPPKLYPLAAPTTPQRRPQANIRTPSEQRASEADAVEALAFMSSPNNSGYYPGTTIHGMSGSPVRAPPRQYLASPNKVILQDAPAPVAKRPLTKKEQDQALDRRLDAMSESEDDDR